MNKNKAAELKFKKTYVEEIYEWVETFVTALVAVVLIFTFIFRVVAVDGESMMKTLHHRDTLIISELVKPKSGDIVVFQYLEESFKAPLIKRVIATEYQTVDIDFSTWQVSVDGEVLDEPYVNYLAGYAMRAGTIKFPYTVDKGQVFVMGDNRNNSHDSRMLGAVDAKKIMGTVLFRVTPLNKFGIIKPSKD